MYTEGIMIPYAYGKSQQLAMHVKPFLFELQPLQLSHRPYLLNRLYTKQAKNDRVFIVIPFSIK